MIAQLKVIGNDIVAGVSDGTAPIGIIDDVRTVAFTKPQVNEVVVIPITATTTNGNGELVNIAEATGFLAFPHVIPESFVTTISVILNDQNGAVIVPANTPLNYDADNDGLYDSFKIIVSYIYRVANRPGDDSTAASGRITVHYSRGIYATDQWDTLQIYPLNATLYVGIDGKLTTKQPTENHPGVAIVTGPPSSHNGTLEFFWL
jgi:hypothetical protein